MAAVGSEAPVGVGAAMTESVTFIGAGRTNIHGCINLEDWPQW